jgi:hypothetical protein
MSSITADYRMNLETTPADPSCLVDFLKAEPFYEATQDIPGMWEDPAAPRAAHWSGVRMALLEQAFTWCRVSSTEHPHLTAASGFPVLTVCLHLSDFIVPALDYLIDAGVLEADDGSTRRFQSLDEMVKAFKETVEADLDAPELRVGASSFDDYEPHAPGAPADLDWLAEMNLNDLMTPGGRLQAYTDLSFLLGARATVAARTATTMAMAANQTGTLLLATQSYLLGGAVTTPPQGAAIAEQISQFLVATALPFPYDTRAPSEAVHGFQLWMRTRWGSATRQISDSMATTIIEKAVDKLTPLRDLLRDFKGSPVDTIREINKLGDAVLPGDSATIRPLQCIVEVNEHLSLEYGAFIGAELSTGARSSRTIIDRILEQEKERARAEKSAVTAGTLDPGEAEQVQPPKRGQVSRAINSDSTFTLIQSAWEDKLKKGGMSDAESLKMLSQVFNAQSVLPKATLLGCKGFSRALYTSSSDFLADLADKSDLLCRYFGQSMAYDDVTKKVPDGLNFFELPPVEMDKLRNLEWHKFQHANAVLVKMEELKAGEKMPRVKEASVWLGRESALALQKVHDKLFKALGYDVAVAAGAGVTYNEFIELALRLQNTRVGKTEDVAARLNATVDRLIWSGYSEAARHAKHTIYGASPANKRLGAWLPEDAVPLTELRLKLQELSNFGTLRRNAPELFAHTGATAAPFGMPLEKAHAKGGPSAAAPDGGGGQPPPTPNKPGKPTGKEKLGGPAAGAPPPPATGKVGSLVTARKVFMYENGTHSYKNWHVNWSGIGDLFGFDASQYCGPAVGFMADEVTWKRDAPKMCPHGGKHAWNAACHQRPMVDGKPFSAKDLSAKIKEAGLATKPDALKGAVDDPNFKPPGDAKTVDGVKVYPNLHF